MELPFLCGSPKIETLDKQGAILQTRCHILIIQQWRGLINMYEYHALTMCDPRKLVE